MRFNLVTHGDQVQITLAAERPETLDLLRRHAEDLRQEFRASGLGSGTLSFGQWSQQNQGTTNPAAMFRPVVEDDLAVPLTAEPISTLRPHVAGAGLDLRL